MASWLVEWTVMVVGVDVQKAMTPPPSYVGGGGGVGFSRLSLFRFTRRIKNLEYLFKQAFV